MIFLLFAILATYRLASMFATEEGTFSVFLRIRERIDPQQTTWIGRGINCTLCVGFWIALIMTFLLAPETWQIFLLTWWGIAGGAVILQKWTERWDSQ